MRSLTSVGLVAALWLTLADAATAQGLPDANPPRIGNPEAPLVVYLYFSPSCPHCAIVFRSLIDDGLPDEPDDRVTLDEAFKRGEYAIALFPVYFGDGSEARRALVADMLARCSSNYAEAMWRLMSQQEQWLGVESDAQAGQAFRQLLTPDDLLDADAFDPCLANTELQEGLVTAHGLHARNIQRLPTADIGGAYFEGADEILKGLHSALGLTPN